MTVVIDILLSFLIGIIIGIIWIKKKNKIAGDDKTKIKKLVRQTARWGTAAEQDINPYIANLHATYSLGYLMALREIYTDEQIKKESGVDIRQLEANITVVMDDAINKLARICPAGQPKNQYLAYLSKEGIKN